MKESERDGWRQRERETEGGRERERERAFVCVCVRACTKELPRDTQYD